MVYMRLHNLKSKVTLWKLYAWCMAVLFACAIADTLMHSPSTVSCFDVAFSIATLIAVFGFAYKKAILESTVWRFWLYWIVAWDLMYATFFEDWSFLNAWNTPKVIIAIAVAVIFAAPTYVALYLYAFRSESLWKIRRGNLTTT